MSSLDAITAALAAKQGNPAAPTQTAPIQQALPFQPRPAPAPQAAPPPPFNTQAAFAAAVPQAAQMHAHPTTGVPFAPINPPGEAAPTALNGLDAAAPTAQVQPAQTDPEPTPPKATRGRKPRTTAATNESPAGAGAGESAAGSALHSVIDAECAELRKCLAMFADCVPPGCTITLAFTGK